MYCVIMAGGSGTRFWPKSRLNHSKQFLTLHGKRSLIQSTVDRISSFAAGEHVYIVSKNDQKEALESQLPEIPQKNFIYEPVGKNTAPCIALAAMHIQKRNAEGIMIVLPSDHLIGNKAVFKKTVMAGVRLAREKEGLITIGITPTRPATGYGYIQQGNCIGSQASIPMFSVKTFAEKPNRETAERFLESGDFLWNSGMFIFRASVFLKAFEEYLPEIYDSMTQIRKEIGKSTYASTLNRVYKQIRSVSIDYGIMEHAKNVYLIKGDFEWNDLGSWEQVYQLTPKDKAGNASVGNAVFHNASNCYTSADEGLIAVQGLDNIIVVRDGNSVLVCKRENCEDVKTLVEVMSRKKMKEFI